MHHIAVRVRPPLKPTDPGYELIPQRFQRSMVHVTAPTSLAVDVPQGRKLFVFDRVFPETVDQDGVWEYLNDSVNSFVQGYNVSLLAYGQSGAGKSYTMGTSGPSEQSEVEKMGMFDLRDGKRENIGVLTMCNLKVLFLVPRRLCSRNSMVLLSILVMAQVQLAYGRLNDTR